MVDKVNFSVTLVPSNDWDNIMETVTLDGAYSEEIKNEVWSAIEKMEDFSKPWIIIRIKEEKASAEIFPNEQIAREYFQNIQKESADEQLFCIPGQYQSQIN